MGLFAIDTDEDMEEVEIKLERDASFRAALVIVIGFFYF